jgi:SAM-dependent methyltransferase
MRMRDRRKVFEGKDVSANPKQSAAAYHYDNSPTGVAEVRTSASIIVPHLVAAFRPRSVVDFGCGLGDWLAEFSRNGCPDVIGYEGYWVPAEHVQIDKDRLRRFDLGMKTYITDRFDLAICLETAEHITPDDADVLLNTLTTCSDVVVFSAAIPQQGGYMHINERYQSYWVAKYHERGFFALDLIRPAIWGDTRVCWWYQQNLLVYVNKSAAKRYELTQRPFMADVVHPFLYDRVRNPVNWSGKEMITALARKVLSKCYGKK